MPKPTLHHNGYDILYKWEQMLRQSDACGEQARWQLYSFLELLKTHVKEKNTVKFYAAKLCICPDYLRQLCKRVFNLTAVECIHQMRMEEAKRILGTEMGISIGEVAHRLHFETLSHFCNSFGEYAGMTPNAYRKQATRSKKL